MLLIISEEVGGSLKKQVKEKYLKYVSLLPSTVHEQRRCSAIIIVESSPLRAISYEAQSKLLVILKQRA